MVSYYDSVYWIGLYHADNGCTGCRGQYVNSSSCLGSSSHACCECRLQWRWLDGSDMSYMNWMVDEPTGESNPCGRIARANSGHQVPEGIFWFDFICTTESNFICKRRIQGKLMLNNLF